MIHWSWTGVAGAGAFILSLIIGLFSEVTAGTLFLRALGGGAFFALIITVIQLVVGRFLPELLEPMDDVTETGDSEAPGESPQGERVNIVLGEDSHEDIPTLEAEDAGSPEFEAQGLDSLTGDGGEEEVTPGEGPIPAFGSVDAEGLQEIPSLTADSAEGSIPDIAAMEGQFSGMSSLDGSSHGGDQSHASAEILGGMHDTEEMAQAVHTILQKDQEG